MPYIETISHEDAEGRLKEIYDDLVVQRGKLAAVHQIQSLHPETIVAHMDLYLKIMFGHSPLKRYQREMMATVVSAANRCAYCTQHHGLALQHFWKDEARVAQLAKDFNHVDLTETDRLLCQLAQHLTLHPDEVDEATIDALSDVGLTDRAILDATLVIAYFNFVNRIVLGLGVELETDGGTGYVYE